MVFKKKEQPVKAKEEKIFEARAPEFRGNGVAVWVNKTEEGKTFLSIKILNSITVAAFKNEPQPDPQPQPQEDQL